MAVCLHSSSIAMPTGTYERSNYECELYIVLWFILKVSSTWYCIAFIFVCRSVNDASSTNHTPHLQAV
nr:hypothetical protein Itr_chr01CG03640 [Ipomoea trifida]